MFRTFFFKRLGLRFWFFLMALIVCAQVIWWATLFFRQIDEITQLKLQNPTFFTDDSDPQNSNHYDILSRVAQRKKIMVMSESFFFLLLVGIGFTMISLSLKVEEKAHRTQKNFIEMVSHESKTPLTALKLRLESLLEKSLGETINNELEKMLKEVQRLSRTFNKMLGWSRIELRNVKPEPIDLKEIIQKTLERIEPLLESESVAIQVEVAAQNVYVFADPQALSTAFQCLLENAITYNDSQQKLIQILISSDTSSYVTISFCDNGWGIPLDEQRELFQRFFRGRNAKGTPGTGLGLHIARQLILAQGGDLKYIRQEKVGTRFDMMIPQAETNA